VPDEVRRDGVRGRRDGVAAALGLGLRMMLQRPKLAAALLMATVAQGALQGLLLLALRQMLIGFSQDGRVSAGRLTMGAAVIFGIWLLRAASSSGGDVLASKLADSVEIASIRKVLAKLLTLSVRFFDKNSREDIVLASYHDLKSIRNVTLAIGDMVQYGSRLVGLIVVAWMMSPELATIGLVLGPLGLLPAHWFGERLTTSAARQREAISALSSSFLAIPAGIKVIKVNRGEPRVLAAASENAESFQRYMHHTAYARGTTRFLFEAVTGLGVVLVLTLGGRNVADGSLSWQSLLSLLVAVVAVYSPMLGMLNVYTNIRTNLATLDRVNHILRSEPEVREAPGARRLAHPPDVIEIQDVSFSYGGRESLQGISATIHRGETIGIVGPSGAGKSTLLSLLLRFYDPTGGAILFDGVDLRELRPGDIADASALVLQDSFLFPGTVADNIRFARPEATMAEVMAAGIAANVHAEVMEMERGYDTVIGHGPAARGLSGGQRQRICIAAALLKNAPVLLLDEATSSLDSVSEAAVQVAIERLMQGRTTFVIAHRLSTLRSADRILVLNGGRLEGLGTHDELIRTCSTYRSLWTSQRAGLMRRGAATAVAIAAAAAGESA
jgi:ATP-binding cassette, subfamily B, bacterial MsbA